LQINLVVLVNFQFELSCFSSTRKKYDWFFTFNLTYKERFMNRRKSWWHYGITVLFTTIFVVFGLACGGKKSAPPPLYPERTYAPAPQPAPAWQLPPMQPMQSAQGSQPAPAQQAAKAEPEQLDAAVREASDYLNKNLKAGNKLVILNIKSDFPALSEYIIDELIANTINDRVFTIVDRQQLDAIRNELNFQMSGEVDDNSAQKAGQMLGAQTIISGGVTKFGDIYRLRVRALGVESAQIEGQFNRNIPSGQTIEALAGSPVSGWGAQTGAYAQSRPAATHQTTAAPSAAGTQPQSAQASGVNWANVETLTSLDKINAYLATAVGRPTSPAPLKVAMPLGNMTNSNSGWHNILTAIEEAKKFVALDLSSCTMVGSAFDPNVGHQQAENAGAAYIVELILPEVAVTIKGAFTHFSSLKKIEGNVNNIGNNIFQEHKRLTAISFPEVTEIGEYAFKDCGSLITVFFPKVMNIHYGAFYGCGSLISVSIPEIANIGNVAFYSCNSLTSVTLGAITAGNFHENSSFPGNLRATYFSHPEGQRAGTYTRSRDSDKWTKKR
jgi:hypothetical protein